MDWKIVLAAFGGWLIALVMVYGFMYVKGLLVTPSEPRDMKPKRKPKRKTKAHYGWK